MRFHSLGLSVCFPSEAAGTQEAELPWAVGTESESLEPAPGPGSATAEQDGSAGAALAGAKSVAGLVAPV